MNIITTVMGMVMVIAIMRDVVTMGIKSEGDYT
jgi:hypothetical protein